MAFSALSGFEERCPGRDLNSHAPCGAGGFKQAEGCPGGAVRSGWCWSERCGVRPMLSDPSGSEAFATISRLDQAGLQLARTALSVPVCVSEKLATLAGVKDSEAAGVHPRWAD